MAAVKMERRAGYNTLEPIRALFIHGIIEFRLHASGGA
jgi:hypothetical protein